MLLYPKRAILDGAEAEIFRLLSYRATPKQWADWLRAPLEHAAARGNLDLVNRLIEAGASARAGWRGCHGLTLLDTAAVGGNPEVVSALLRAGCRPDAFDEEGSTTLHLAAALGHKNVASVLLASKLTDKNAMRIDGKTPLIIACEEGHLSMVCTLLAAGADVAFRNATDGTSPFDVAASSGRIPIMTALLEHGVDVHNTDERGVTALHCATESGGAAVEMLLDAGADIEAKTTDGQTPIFWAAGCTNLESTLALLRRGAKINERDGGESTVLHEICRGHCWVGDAAAVVDLLLRCGASETAVDENDLRPVEYLEPAKRRYCCADETGRVRVLLERAPADRAWRRRCWMVMLRSRAEKEGKAHYVGVGSGDRGKGGARGCCGEERVGSKRIGRTYESAGGGAGDGRWGHTDGEKKAVDGEENWSGAVSMLIGLELEGVFRKVVAFL